MTDHAATEGSTLVRVQVMTAELATGDPTDRVNEVGPVEILEPVLIRVMGVGTTVEIIGRRILSTLLVTCIL